MTGSTSSAALVAGLRRQLLAERRIRDDERADQLGREHPLGLVEAARHPARQARPRLGHLGVAQLGPQRRVEDSRGLRPDGRPARGVEPGQRRLGRIRTGPGTAVSRSDLRPSGLMSAENVVSMRRDARSSNASCWAAAMAIAFSVVKSYWGGDRGAGGLAGGIGLELCSRSRAARGATMSRVASWPSATWSGASGRMSAPRIAARARIRIPAAIARRGTSARVNRFGVSIRWVSMAGSSGSGLSGSRRRARRGPRPRAPGRRAR